MNDLDATSGRRHRNSKPLDRRRLEDLALAYVARFATSGGKLRSYLQRKLRERGYEGGDGADAPDLDGLIARFAARGYIDDESYGRARAGDLAGRGYGARRVEQALRAAGIAEDLRSRLAPGEHESRRAGLLLARKRGFGPFAKPLGVDPEQHRRRGEKQLAAMVRAGHDFAVARRVVEARSIEELEEWVEESRSE